MVGREKTVRGVKPADEQAYTELARRYLAWIGPASIAEFQWFSALGVKAAKAAIEPLKLEPLASGDDRLMLPGDRVKLEAFKPPKDPQYVLVSSLDATVLLRRDLKSLLDSKDMERQGFVHKGTKALRGLADPPNPPLRDRARRPGASQLST